MYSFLASINDYYWCIFKNLIPFSRKEVCDRNLTEVYKEHLIEYLCFYNAHQISHFKSLFLSCVKIFLKIGHKYICVEYLMAVVNYLVSCFVFIAYSTFYIVGLILSMQIPFVGFQPIRTSEHMAAAGMEKFLKLRWKDIVKCFVHLKCVWLWNHFFFYVGIKMGFQLLYYILISKRL